jgi:Flp pilus assembly secretin CpaC
VTPTSLSKFAPRTLAVILVAAVASSASAAEANDAAAVMPQIKIDREVGAARDLSLEMGQNRLLVLSEPIARVSVADPKVADMKVITPTQLLLTARGVGSTDLTLWNKRDEPLVLALLVNRNLDALRKQLKELFPTENIIVSAAGDLVVLSGEASDVRVPERAAEVAQLHAEKVANLMRVSGNQQVQLEVKFAEVSRSALRSMGFNVFHRDAGGQLVGGLASSGTAPGQFLTVPGTGTASVPDVYGPATGGGFSLFFSGLANFPFSAILSLLESNQLSKTLAEPTLVAMSGQEAKFLAGGEFPIPVSAGPRRRRRPVEEVRHHPRVHAHGRQRGVLAPQDADGGQRHRRHTQRERQRVRRARPHLAPERDDGAALGRAELRDRGLAQRPDPLGDRQDPAPRRHPDPGRALSVDQLST